MEDTLLFNFAAALAANRRRGKHTLGYFGPTLLSTNPVAFCQRCRGVLVFSCSTGWRAYLGRR